MFPLPFVVLAAIGTTLISKHKLDLNPKGKTFSLKPHAQHKYRLQSTSGNLHNPILSIIGNLRSKLSKGLQSTTKPDHEHIVRSFLPEGANILIPKSPSGSQRYLVSDIDGDSENEIIFTYNQREEVKTMILKQHNGSWYKALEIIHPNNSILHYRNIAYLSSEHKKQLLIGVKEDKKSHSLLGYSFEDSDINTLFSLDYDRLELTGNKDRGKLTSMQRLAIWKKDSYDTYNIDVFSLEDSALKSIDNISSYYTNRVIPYYTRRVKNNPNECANWYNLAEALVRINAHNEAQMAINMGRKLDSRSIFKERFDYLKSNLT